MVGLQTWMWMALAAAAGAAAQNPGPNCGVQPLGGQWPATAKFVSGLNRGTLASEQETAWAAYSKISTTDWSALKKRYLTRIDSWRGRALTNVPAAGAAFYPFGGPDAANLLAFFPEAHEYVIVGLEPIGCLPLRAADYTDAYFSALRGDLSSVVANGFFRTKEMGGDFKEGAVNGVFPLLLFLLARSGYSVEEAAPIQISSSGALVSPSPASRNDANQPKAETDGVAIRFSDSRHGSRMLRYFTLNLQSSRLNRKPGTLKYLNGLPTPVTLIKSASYLLHKTYFSTTRDLILSKSAVVVEDDSGIPYRYFDAAHWDVRLYGKYTDPIALFKVWKQDDLRAAYAAQKEKQPLDFGIGYRHPGEGNLLVAVRRATGSR